MKGNTSIRAIEGRLTYLCEEKTPPLGCFVPKNPYIDSALVKSFKRERKQNGESKRMGYALTSILQAHQYCKQYAQAQEPKYLSVPLSFLLPMAQRISDLQSASSLSSPPFLSWFLTILEGSRKKNEEKGEKTRPKWQSISRLKRFFDEVHPKP
jgi:hypothetical protein